MLYTVQCSCALRPKRVDTPSLGNLIQTGRSLMTVASLRYQLFFPVAVLVVITVSFYIIGNAFADAADPKNHVR